MADNNNKPINLRQPFMKKGPRPQPLPDDKRIERLFDDAPAKEIKREQQNINMPTKAQSANLYQRALTLVVAAAIIIGAYYFWTHRKPSANPENDPGKQAQQTQTAKWYAVKLADGEVYYGQIKNLSADPISMANVYYNYDQVKDAKKEISEVGSIRLVKRGQESHGPTGDLEIVRAQVLFMEPLADGSKVLKAILENEGNSK